MQQQLIKISKLKGNNGQISGLPKNPRKITSGAKDALRKSIVESPEIAEWKCLLVYPFEDNYVVIAGNQRLGLYKDLKYKEVLCFVLPPETTVEKLKEYSIRDNVNSGDWDWTQLNENWGDISLFGLWETEPEKATTSVNFEATNPKHILLTVEFDSLASQEVLYERLKKEGFNCWLGKKKPKE
jgi:hypothetical protein